MYVGLDTTYWGAYYDVDMETFEKMLYDGEHTVVEAQEEMLELAKERLLSGEIDFARLFSKNCKPSWAVMKVVHTTLRPLSVPVFIQ